MKKGMFSPVNLISKLCTVITLLATQYLAQLVEYDERCNTTHPYRCQSNSTCFESHAVCNISNMCSTPGKGYQCPDNECSDRFFNCKTKQLDCRYKTQTRCPDGFCRVNECKNVKYSSCPMNQPLLCGTGKCVSYLFQCAGGSYCPLNNPFLCSDMSCVDKLEECTETKMGGTFPKQIIKYDAENPKIDQMTTIYKGSQEGKKVLGSLMITVKLFFDAFNSPTFSPFKDDKLKDSTMVIEPHPLHDLMYLTNQLNSTLAGVARNFFMISEEKLPYYISIRSAAIKVSSSGRNDDNEYFKVPFKVEFAIDSIKKHQIPISNYSDFLCLGRVNTVLNTWECINRKILNLREVGQKTNFELLKTEYDIPAPGIYAVIFRPRMTPNLYTTSYCGLVCKHKKTLIAMCFIILPFLFSLLCMCWNYLLLSWEAKEREAEAIQRREKLIQMEQMTAGFKGESLKEKLADNMFYNQNPLQGKSLKQLDDTNKLNNMVERMERDLSEINQVKKDLLAKTKRQIQKISVIRDNIENLGTNRFDVDIGIEYNPTGNYLD